MSSAYLQSEAVDQDRRLDCRPTTTRGWSDIPEYALDDGGPLGRRYQQMGAGFADIPVFDHLRNVASQYPDKLAIGDGANRLTYSELFRAVETLSHRIAAVVPERQAVGILQANSTWYAVAILASMAAGRPSVPLNMRDPGSRIIEIANAARLGAIIGAGNVRPIDLAPEVLWIDIAAGVAPNGQQASQQPKLPSVSVDAPAMVLYTSGSTGRPKGIVNSQRSLLWRVRQYVEACHINADDVFLPLTGPATIAGCREILTALLTGATLHLLEVEAVGLRAVRARVQAEGVTIAYLVPALLRALLTEAPADAFQSLRVARIGGEKVSWTDIALLRKAVSDQCLIQIGYSSTETTGSQWFLPQDWPEQDASIPVGRLLPGMAFAIVDEAGRNVGTGESGELLIRSPYVLLGHWENGVVVPARPDPDDPGVRVFATGDLVRLDGDGLLRIVGRKGRQIKINGRRVEPAELERVLRCAPSVADAVAIVTPAEELIAFAAPQHFAGAAFAEELRQLVRTTLPAPLRPLRLHTIAEIPRLPGGKVDLATLTEMDRSERETAPVAQPTTARPLPVGGELNTRQIVQHAWMQVLNTGAAAGNWDDAGGDSLQLLHCVMAIESAIGQELGLEAFTVGMSFDEMVEAVVSAQAGEQRAKKLHPPMLFLFPGSVGYGPSLAAFAAAMGKVARVNPIRYPGLAAILDGHNSLAAMAAAALGQIDRAQPTGPVRLLGHSLGGAVAFEVAARLLAAGRSVRFLGILDTSLLDEPSNHWGTLTRTFHRIRTNRISAHRMACRALAKITVAMGCEAYLARILDRFAKGEFSPTSFRTKLELQEVMRARSFFQWLEAPKPALPISGTLFRCRREGMPRALGWDSALAHLDVVPIMGNHIDLVIEPNLATNRPLIETAVVQTYSAAESRKREDLSST
ncbi:non-ribosomal peptide synthetase [Mesorhizobium sp. 113-3-3]|uniref:non-ribosomal peptide synthetase n=1 Tax=Mesorhizobium sp. 113-3-3 TaxID=2744516 RepID=UPI0019277856|nr:AMP-binding protein [Mesorhizobium sp. 113-3-3]